MQQFEGTILAGDSFDPIRGRVVVDGGHITAVEEATTTSTDIVVPAFVNAHTHIGDSVAKEAGVGLSLDAAVAPPASEKHRRLAAASREELTTAMRRTLRFMEQTGTAAHLDFRESGVAGTEALQAATSETATETFIFGSGPSSVVAIADGYGASGANDDEFTPQREAAREANKPFAIHAGEPDASDIHPALEYEPELLVHMVHAEADHLERVADENVPIAVCPRANAVLGVGRPPIRDILDHTTVALGTDNVMLNPPSMFREMAFTARSFDVTDREVLRMATQAGAAIADRNCGVIEAGRQAALLVLDGDSDNLSGTVNPVAAVVRRATGRDIKQVVL